MRVEHEETQRRFVVRVNGDEAELAYQLVSPTVMDIQHTWVPRGARGHGVAEALATAAFEYARERGYRVIPTCPFVRKWLGTHPDEAKLVDASAARSIEVPPRP